MNKTTIHDAIQKVAVGPERGRDLSREAARSVMQEVLSGSADEVQIAVLLIALRMKRETEEEFLGLFDALQASLQQHNVDVPELVCLADPFDGYLRHITVTPFIPAVLAACGLPTLMHGVESVGPKFGVTACQVYQRAGIKVDGDAMFASTAISSVGWAYIDQRVYAPNLYRLINIRDRMIKRSALTTLERLLMPLRASGAMHMVLGYVHKAYPQIYATVAMAAGYDSVLLTKGVEGGLAPALNKPLRRFYFTGQVPGVTDEHKEVIDYDLGFNASSAALLVGDSSLDPVQTCLETGLKVLAGEPGVARDSLLLAAGQIMATRSTALTIDLVQAVEKVRHCLDNGSALRCFEQMVKYA